MNSERNLWRRCAAQIDGEQVEMAVVGRARNNLSTEGAMPASTNLRQLFVAPNFSNH